MGFLSNIRRKIANVKSDVRTAVKSVTSSVKNAITGGSKTTSSTPKTSYSSSKLKAAVDSKKTSSRSSRGSSSSRSSSSSSNKNIPTISTGGSSSGGGGSGGRTGTPQIPIDGQPIQNGMTIDQANQFGINPNEGMSQIQGEQLTQYQDMPAYQQALLGIAGTGTALGNIGKGLGAGAEAVSALGQTTKGGAYYLQQAEGAMSGSNIVFTTGGGSTIGATAQGSKYLGAGLTALGLTITGVMLAKDYIQTKLMAGFVRKEELPQTVGMGFNMAYKNGDLQGMIDIRDAIAEVQENSSNINKLFPWLDMADALKEYDKVATIQTEIQSRIIEDFENGTLGENGTGYSVEAWKERDREKYEMEQQLRMDWEESRKRMLEFELAAKKADRIEEAEMWAKMRKQADEDERIQAEWLAEFWLLYKQKILELENSVYESRGRSTLGFGLF